MLLIISVFMLSCNDKQKKPGDLRDVNFIALSQNILSAAKEGSETKVYEDSLKQIDLDDLRSVLNSDNKRLAFWLNIYNAYTQVILKRDPELFKDRDSFFSSPQINIGQEILSLDQVEHDLLRRSKVKYSRGYLNKLFTNTFEENFRVDTLDYRIHFALNCGAKSCPPIKFYDPLHIDEQLSLATKSYLRSETEYRPIQNAVAVPALMSWFKNDFGGERGILDILKKLNLIPAQSIPRIEYKEYDWTLELDNYNIASHE